VGAHTRRVRCWPAAATLVRWWHMCPSANISPALLQGLHRIPLAFRVCILFAVPFLLRLDERRTMQVTAAQNTASRHAQTTLGSSLGAQLTRPRSRALLLPPARRPQTTLRSGAQLRQEKRWRLTELLRRRRLQSCQTGKTSVTARSDFAHKCPCCKTCSHLVTIAQVGTLLRSPFGLDNATTVK
jgi:hypothetical protein